MTLVPGMLVDKYRVDRLLGDGGMGAVYLAEHVVLGRRAAIKVLHPHITGNAEIVQRFINEAIGAASLNHRNIIHVLDCGQLPGSGAWYIALEFLDGLTLAFRQVFYLVPAYFPNRKVARFGVGVIKTAHGRWRRHRKALREGDATGVGGVQQLEERRFLGVIRTGGIPGGRANAAILFADQVFRAQ